MNRPEDFHLVWMGDWNAMNIGFPTFVQAPEATNDPEFDPEPELA